jgi:hypothetical protein
MMPHDYPPVPGDPNAPAPANDPPVMPEPEPEPDAPVEEPDAPEQPDPQPVSAHRRTLMDVGEARVKMLLENGMMVQHMIPHAIAYLEEMAGVRKKEKEDAAVKGDEPIGHVAEHQDGSGGREAAEASGRDSVS